MFSASLLVESPPAIADAGPAEFVGTPGNEALAQKKKFFTSNCNRISTSRHRPVLCLVHTGVSRPVGADFEVDASSRSTCRGRVRQAPVLQTTVYSRTYPY